MFESNAYMRTVNDSYLLFLGGNAWNNGASIALHGKDSIDAGIIELHVSDGINFKSFILTPDGRAYWDRKNLAMQEDVIPRSGGAVINGILLRNDDNKNLNLGGGSAWDRGANIYIFGNAHPTNAGAIQLTPLLAQGNSKGMYLYPSGTWTWDGTAVQITSDQRLKQQINQIDDKLLDAWEDVTLVQFKYNDAVEEKGNQARLHTGYVVQQINEACQKHNIDISEYGLYCHEEYPERTEEVTIENEDGTTKKETRVIEESSEHYSLRYTETLVVECAYLRRENSRLKERLSKIENLLNI